MDVTSLASRPEESAGHADFRGAQPLRATGNLQRSSTGWRVAVAGGDGLMRSRVGVWPWNWQAEKQARKQQVQRR